MQRREFIKTISLAAAIPFFNFRLPAMQRRKMLVIGFDGMDPLRVRTLLEQNRLPNIKKLANRGIFTMMHSTVPAQSPVAWASFIVGADPGMHGIFDFLHRNPDNYFPRFAQSETLPAEKIVKIGNYRIPLKSGQVILKREGKAFWDYLEEHDIPATIFKIPANYPPSKSKQKTISGMGTPDLLGTYGIYTLYTSDENEAFKELSAANIFYAYENEKGEIENTHLPGPKNTLHKDQQTIDIPFRTYLDRKNRTLRIDIQGKKILLAEKEYSEWVEIKFPLINHLTSIRGMVRFYFLSIEPHFRLYISPLHISPLHPAIAISTPDDYSVELAEKVGLFHTIGLPADTKALSNETFNLEQFLVQSNSVLKESSQIFDHYLNEFVRQQEGLLFFYFSSLDQCQHMLWAAEDSKHPYFHPHEAKNFSGAIDQLYIAMDRELGKAIAALGPECPIIAISDHGFAPFYYKVNINNWLVENGYLKMKSGSPVAEQTIFDSVNWAESKAYAVGLNGLYLNLKGREAEGSVRSEEKRKVLEELKQRLESWIYSGNGQPVIKTAYIAEDTFSPRYLNRAPDIVLGFNRTFRIDDNSALGSFSNSAISENRNWWSGDHCLDPLTVPATFLASFSINSKFPAIIDIAPTILRYFGIDFDQKEIKGKSLI